MIRVHASGSKGNFYSLETTTGKLLLEAGINIKKIKESLNFDLNNICGCLLTHKHKDHSQSIEKIIELGIDVYGSEGTREELNISNCGYKIIKHNEPFTIGEFYIVPFDTQHDTKEPLSFFIYHPELGKILFVTDTMYLKNRFQNIDHILIECNYSESVLPYLPEWRARTLKSHMSLETLKDTLKSWDLTGTEDITLIHISEDNGEPERFREEIESLTRIKTYIGESGLIIK